MANYYVDSNTGDNGDNGTTQALAFATLEYALESGGLSGTDNKIWVRRTHSEIPTSDIAPVYDGAPGTPLEIIGWPRPSIPNTTITEATWANGSTTVDLIVGITCTRESHCGRYVTAPDGKQYMITRVIDANTIIIDRKYVGSSVDGVDGKFQIEADEDYATRPTDIDGWDADAIALPVIDFDDGNFELSISSSDYFYVLKNLELKDSTDGYGIIYFSGSGCHTLQGCLLKQTTQSDPIMAASTCTVFLIRTIIEGSGAGSLQNGIYLRDAGIVMKDVAIYNCGNNGISCTYSGLTYIDNVNIGIEVANGDDDIDFGSSSNQGGRIIEGRDLRLGGTNGYVLFGTNTTSIQLLAIENYNKILGDHKSWYPGGTWEKAAVTGETPNKKVSNDVLKISPNLAGYQYIPEWAVCVFEHEFKVTTDQKSYKYWLYNDTGDTLNDGNAKGSIWLELEYVEVYDDTSEYVIKEYSSETGIADAADADDWDYLQITNITPAVASKLRIKCFCRHYTASGDIFVDPAVVIS